MDTSHSTPMVHKEAIMIIDNAPPRLTWEQAQAVLEQHIQNTVAENNEFIAKAVAKARLERSRRDKSDIPRIWIGKAKEARHQSRLMLATLETMMRGV